MAPDKTLAHDRLADVFDEVMNSYDVQRRLEVLIDTYLAEVDLAGRPVLDVGTGTGRGAKWLRERGASVIALDIGFKLVKRVSASIRDAVVADAQRLPFASASFPIVFSTEAIEHMPDPLEGVTEMVRVLQPGGHLVLSTPNRLWQAPVRLASVIGLRPYDGYENFLTPGQLRRHLQSLGMKISAHRGIHLWPFQLGFTTPLLRIMDRFGTALLPVMINQAIHCIKPPASS